MRVYLPVTTTGLRELRDVGELAGSTPLTAFAVTPGLRAWYVEGDDEELEYAAMLEAARASLRLLDADPSAERRRAVLAVDLEDAEVAVRDDLDRGVVQLTEAVPITAVAAVHIDLADATVAVAAAAAAIVRADLGDAAAQDAVDDAEGFDLAWFATQEIGQLLDADGFDSGRFDTD